MWFKQGFYRPFTLSPSLMYCLMLLICFYHKVNDAIIGFDVLDKLNVVKQELYIVSHRWVWFPIIILCSYLDYKNAKRSWFLKTVSGPISEHEFQSFGILLLCCYFVLDLLTNPKNIKSVTLKKNTHVSWETHWTFTQL